MAEGNGHNHGGRDDGAARETRLHPCQKTTWCILGENHAGECIDIPRKPHERPAWDKKTPDPKGWREIQPNPPKLKKP